VAKTKAKPYHHGALRAALLAAADRLVRTRGGGAVTLREVARKAGVSHAAPYHHFRSRDELLAAVAAAGFDRLRVEIDTTLGGAPASPEARWRAGAASYLRFALDNGNLYRIMFDDAGSGRSPALIAAARGAFEPLVAGARATTSEADAEELARTAWALLHGIAILALAGRAGLPTDPASVVAWAEQAITRLTAADLASHRR